MAGRHHIGFYEQQGKGTIMTSNISRRAVNIGAAWSVPVILTAIAAPTAAASTAPPVDPPPTCIPGVSYAWVGVQEWNGKTLPQGVQIYNHTGRAITVMGEVTNTPDFVDVGVEEAEISLAHNGGAFRVDVPDGGSVILRIGVEKASNNSAGFMRLTSACDGLGRFQMKSVNKIDRLGGQEGDPS